MSRRILVVGTSTYNKGAELMHAAVQQELARTANTRAVVQASFGSAEDRANYGAEMNVPVEDMNYSDFIKNGRWGEVDEVLRGVYQEASQALGRTFEYPRK